MFKMCFARPQSGWTVTPVRSVSSLSSGTSNRCGTVRRSAYDRYCTIPFILPLYQKFHNYETSDSETHVTVQTPGTRSVDSVISSMILKSQINNIITRSQQVFKLVQCWHSNISHLT